MRKVFPGFLLALVLSSIHLCAQDGARDTIPVQADPRLLGLNTSRNPQEFVIAGVEITGTQYLDNQLLLSISGINIGDVVIIPGTDKFRSEEHTSELSHV